MTPMSSALRCCPSVDVHSDRERRDTTMKAAAVQYRTKPERADENQELIEAVFADLEARDAEGFTYKVFLA